MYFALNISQSVKQASHSQTQSQLFTPTKLVARHTKLTHLVPKAESEERDSQPPAAEPSVAPPATQVSPPEQPAGNKGLLAGGAVGLGAGLFLALRLAAGGPSFAALEADAVPLDAALRNGRPTVVEFYADWCEVSLSLLLYLVARFPLF